MASTLDSIVPEALELSPRDRFQLASQLLRSVPRETGEDWSKEIVARIDAYDAGEMEAVPIEDTILKIRRQRLG